MGESIEIGEFIHLLNKLPGGLGLYRVKWTKTGNLQILSKSNREYVGYLDMKNKKLVMLKEKRT